MSGWRQGRYWRSQVRQGYQRVSRARGEPCAVVAPTPEGDGGVVDPVRRSDGASRRHAEGAGRIAGGLGVAGAAVAMVLVSRLLGAFAGSDPPCAGRG